MSDDQGARPSGGARDVPPECARLAATLRELRAGMGLSLAALAARTPYSKSSWERYLNGRTLPPRRAVEHLCTLAGTDPQRPLALWALAETAWSGRTGRPEKRKRTAPDTRPNTRPSATTPPTTTPPTTVPVPPAEEPPRPRPRVSRLHAAILGGVALLAAGTLIVLSRAGGGDGGGPAGNRTAAADLSAPIPGCQGAACTGKDAEDQECSTAAQPPTSLGEQRLDGTMVKVRFSAVCTTVWARIDRGTVGDHVEIAVPGTEVQRARVKDRFDAMGSLSTPMAHAPDAVLNRVRACLVRQGERHCFTATPDWTPDRATVQPLRAPALPPSFM
ncbi:XRE family transcriptional regulator [Streptomyces sp. TRM68367]|uniref:helix-turn-helix domain-containing protein n=1 Tax=Streptomyces sp. TRM68367 TaxID=2758415 RepID=UPI00165AD71C|nr:XRE family transcriptional regulator [Streptomyces sp. TRM68367]MBC9725780.1 helix-turn-helix domain-containing protein [Streptomyces sp. TRM68367]